MPKSAGRPVRWVECPRKLCSVDISQLDQKSRYKHVKSCIKRQQKESELLADLKKHKMAEIESEDYVASADMAETRFDYKQLMSLVKVKPNRGGEAQLAFWTQWKDFLNEVKDFLDDGGRYDPLVRLVLIVLQGLSTQDDFEFDIPSNGELYDLAPELLDSECFPDWGAMVDAMNGFAKFVHLD